MKWAFLFLASSLLFGTDCCPPGALKTPSCTCKQFEGQTGKLYSAVPCQSCTPCSAVWTGGFSLLAWQAREEGLAFAFDNSPEASSASVNIDGKLVDIDFNWEPAFKIDLGCLFPDRSWDFSSRWTYFYTHSTHTAHASPNADSTGLFPLWVLPSGNTAPLQLYGTARGSWQLHLNEIDLEMGYHPFLTPALSIRFDGGLKLLSADQRFRVDYSDGITAGGVHLVSAQAVLHNKALGIGPRLGFDSKWRLGKGWSLIGNLAGSLPLCSFKIHRNDYDVSERLPAGTASFVDSFFKQSVWVFRPVLEAALGFGWDACFGCRKQYAFGLQANYELQYFWEQNLMGMLVNEAIIHQVFQPRGDLQLHGATLAFTFGY